jgi:hypothetical protein
MAIKFHGTFEDLHRTLSGIGIAGAWAPEPNGVYMMRCRDGANLHWASGSKTLWVDGKPAAANAVLKKIEQVVSGHRKLPDA